MVNCNDKNLDRIFQALAHPVRRQILLRVARSSCTVYELAEPFAISAPAISRHLKVLEDARMLVREKSGKYHRLSVRTTPRRGRRSCPPGNETHQVNVEPLREVMDWMKLFEAQWDKHLLQLKQQIEADL